jgi:hypothetical protein
VDDPNGTFVIRAKASASWAIRELGETLRKGSPDEARSMARQLLPFWESVAHGETSRGFVEKTLRVAEALDSKELASSLLKPFGFEQLAPETAPCGRAFSRGTEWSGAGIASRAFPRAVEYVLALELFRRHVLDGPEDDTRVRQRLLARGAFGVLGTCPLLPKKLRHAEIEELHSRLRNHDVPRFQIAVHHPLPMGLIEGIGDLDSVAKREVEPDGSFFQTLPEGLTLDALHDQEIDAVLASDVVERADVRMVQARDRPRLALETHLTLGVGGELVGKNFDGHAPAETRVASLVNLSIPPLPRRDTIS